jgi:hypothetical protein
MKYYTTTILKFSASMRRETITGSILPEKQALLRTVIMKLFPVVAFRTARFETAMSHFDLSSIF